MRRASSTPEMISTSTPASRRARKELVSVLGLPHRTRRDRPDRRARAVGDLLDPTQSAHPALDRRLGQPLHVAAARAESDHFLELFDHVEPVAGTYASHDEMDRVRADVDRGEQVGHAMEGRASGRSEPNAEGGRPMTNW